MALTDIQTLRMRVADRPEFHHDTAEQNESGNKFFQLSYSNLVASPAPAVYKNGTLQTVTTHYTIDLVNGSVTFVTAPALGDDLAFDYTSTVWTDEEVQYFIDTATGNSLNLAAANLLLAWAADAARTAKKESMSGGGGMGSYSVTIDARARELRETAKAYFTQWQQNENQGIAAEGITEIAWTEHMVERAIYNNLIENL